MSKPPASASGVMKVIQRKVGFGDVRVTLSGDDFVAHAFPTREAALRQFLATDRSADTVEFVERVMTTPIAYGSGRTAEAALDDLNSKL